MNVTPRRIWRESTGNIKRRCGPGRPAPIRQLAVDLSINPNTVMRAYRELEIRGMIDTQQGTGTFISARRPRSPDAERQRQLNQMVSEWIARAGAAGFTIEEILEQIHEYQSASDKIRR